MSAPEKVVDVLTGQAGKIVGGTIEGRPIVKWDDGRVTSRSKSTLKGLAVAPIPSAAERSAALAQQSKDLASEALGEVMAKVTELEGLTRNLATLEPLPAGIREQMRQLADNLLDRKQGVMVLRGRR